MRRVDVSAGGSPVPEVRECQATDCDKRFSVVAESQKYCSKTCKGSAARARRSEREKARGLEPQGKKARRLARKQEVRLKREDARRSIEESGRRPCKRRSCVDPVPPDAPPEQKYCSEEHEPPPRCISCKEMPAEPMEGGGYHPFCYSCFLDYLDGRNYREAEREAEWDADRFADGLKECLSGDRGTIKATTARKWWECLMCSAHIHSGDGYWRLQFTVDASTYKGYRWETAAVCDPCVGDWAEQQVDTLVKTPPTVPQLTSALGSPGGRGLVGHRRRAAI